MNIEIIFVISTRTIYIILKIFRKNGDYAPIAAFEKVNREIYATAFLTKDNNVQITVEYVLDYWKNSFNKKLLNNEIVSFIILYHVHVMPEGKKFDIAKDIEYANAIAIYFKDEKIKIDGTIILPYSPS